MVFWAWLKRLLCRRLLTLVLVLYFLMILVFLLSIDIAEPEPEADESFALIFPEPTLYIRSESLTDVSNRSLQGRNKNVQLHNLVDGFVSRERIFAPLENSESMVKFYDPVPLSQPMTDKQFHREKSGDFISLGEGSYVYSAFLDDRKEERFVRILTLMSEEAFKQAMYCHFNDNPNALPQKAESYQLCENHNKMYGGYLFSCLVPQDNSSMIKLASIGISVRETGPKVTVAVHATRPPEKRVSYLNLYPQETYDLNNTKIVNNNLKLNVPSIRGVDNNTPGNIEEPPSHPNLSFAICVSPLFGNISVHRLIEFVELSRLLGAEHFIFYNYSLPQQVSDALHYYLNKKIVSVLPWRLPPGIKSVWYYGQLLANNDCLYRTMPHFDLVSFNDIDEFIVPHSNASTWKEAFSSLLTDDRCGFSFQSAFYDPGIREPFESTLLTPALTARTEMINKIRTKVILCPWRVFEVGIHHISKQNREEWRPLGVHPSVAYLHHYRRCVPNFGMNCNLWERDTIIADKYLKNLSMNYERELNNILYGHENMGD